jgi:hypothetical protein
MTTLKMETHMQTGRAMVEVYDDDGNFVATIYPTDNNSNGIHIVSKYFADNPINPSVSMIPVPGFLIQFKDKR